MQVNENVLKILYNAYKQASKENPKIPKSIENYDVSNTSEQINMDVNGSVDVLEATQNMYNENNISPNDISPVMDTCDKEPSFISDILFEDTWNVVRKTLSRDQF